MEGSASSTVFSLGPCSNRAAAFAAIALDVALRSLPGEEVPGQQEEFAFEPEAQGEASRLHQARLILAHATRSSSKSLMHSRGGISLQRAPLNANLIAALATQPLPLWTC